MIQVEFRAPEPGLVIRGIHDSLNAQMLDFLTEVLERGLSSIHFICSLL